MRLDEVKNNLVEVSLYIIVVYNVHQEHLVTTTGQKLYTFNVTSLLVSILVILWVVDLSPGVCEGVQALLLPDQEGLVVNHSWLNDFLALKHTPRDCVDVVICYVFIYFSMDVDGLESDVLKLVQILNQTLYN
jgi:hypothetical protein